MAKTGQRRKTHRPFAIDRLPAEWGERVIALRAKWMPWERIEEETSHWEWDKLQAEQRQLYPKRRIPMRTLHRWYDVQWQQRRVQVQAEHQAALAIAEKFDAPGHEKLDERVKNALADMLFTVKSTSDPEAFRKKALDLAWLLARNRQLDIAEEKVDVERKKIEDVIARGNKATIEAADKLSRGGHGVSIDDINRIRSRVFGLPPIERGKPKLTGKELADKFGEIYGIPPTPEERT
jgi:hypothetical protein